MGIVVARGLGGSGRVRGLRKGEREEVGWDGVRQLGGVRPGRWNGRAEATPVSWNASPCTRVPQYLGMHPHIMGHPSVWEYIPI
jgi:hypothetical protein